MPFSVKSSKNGVTYYLHTRRSDSGNPVLYYFARQVKSGADDVPLDALPAGYRVIESAQTGLPLLKRQA